MFKEETRIFVGGLSWDTTERQIEYTFSRFGKVLDVQIIVKRETGRPCGFGFVTFSNRCAMEASISKLHNKELGGRRISINEVKPKVRSDDTGYAYVGGDANTGDSYTKEEQTLLRLMSKMEDLKKRQTGDATEESSQAMYAHPSGTTEWIVDSDASRHVPGDLGKFTSYSHITSPDDIQTTDETFQPVVGKGMADCTGLNIWDYQSYMSSEQTCCLFCITDKENRSSLFPVLIIFVQVYVNFLWFWLIVPRSKHA